MNRPMALVSFRRSLSELRSKAGAAGCSATGGGLPAGAGAVDFVPGGVVAGAPELEAVVPGAVAPACPLPELRRVGGIEVPFVDFGCCGWAVGLFGVGGVGCDASLFGAWPGLDSDRAAAVDGCPEEGVGFPAGLCCAPRFAGSEADGLGCTCVQPNRTNDAVRATAAT